MIRNEYFRVFPEAIPSGFVDKIIAIGDQQKPSLARVNSVAGLSVVDKEYRYCNIARLANEPDLDWLYIKLWELLDEVNKKNWKFNIEKMSLVEYLTYLEGHNINWHRDTLPLTARKRNKDPSIDKLISLSLQLSDHDEYEGGNFQFSNDMGLKEGKFPVINELAENSELAQQLRKKGSIVVFPSVLMHRVTKVTKGARKVLVAWAGGNSVENLDV
ncbi:MAG: 2OG-Fe(II) oxygenase [Pseudomonadota bacterium]|nr:2OG-Fe(II) oxygenase [Pseudomonadota bacterium]